MRLELPGKYRRLGSAANEGESRSFSLGVDVDTGSLA
jgi:hypothetical protein